MPTETTATLLLSRTQPFFSGSVFCAEHLLMLNEGFRAYWQVIPLDAEIARATLPAAATGAPRWTVGVASAPQRLLTHGLLTYLAVTSPVQLLERPELARLVSRPQHADGPLTTRVPDDNAARAVFDALP